jgi:hypothetical protein
VFGHSLVQSVTGGRRPSYVAGDKFALAVVEALKDGAARPAPTTLAAIADDAPEPWATMFTEHREVLRALLDDVASLDGIEQLSLAEFLG